jgi:hypothetical protein
MLSNKLVDRQLNFFLIPAERVTRHTQCLKNEVSNR